MLGVLCAAGLSCHSEEEVVLPGVAGACSLGVIEAIDRGQFDVVADLRRRGADLFCRETQDRLEQAVARGDLPQVEGLLDLDIGTAKGAGDLRGRSDLVASALAHPDRTIAIALAQLLVRRGASPDLRYAYRDGRHTCRADDTGLAYPCYAVEIESGTLLMIAAVKGDVEMTARLLDLGADAGLQDMKHRTALDLARQFGHDDVAVLVESQGPR